MDERIERTLKNLERNRMAAQYVPTLAQVAPAVEKMLSEDASVAVGGSMTLAETGVLELLRSGRYRFLDRYAPDLTPQQRQAIFRQSFSVDFYLASANAVTENGELYNVDGSSNRVAAIAHGPAAVIIVAGINKLVPDLPAAVRRVKTVAAPRNAQRLQCDTYCAKTGHCVHVEGGMTDGCAGDGRICRNYLVSGPQPIPGRIRVLLVDEECGY